MTFSEFIGIKNANIDVETGEVLSHKEVYRRAIERLGGLGAIKPLIPFSIEQIRKALANGDEYLNSLSLNVWDYAAGFRKYSTYHYVGSQKYTDTEEYDPNSSKIWYLYKAFGITSASCAEGVCLLKEAARMWAEEEKKIGQVQ